jgi:hypothetical protein
MMLWTGIGVGLVCFVTIWNMLEARNPISAALYLTVGGILAAVIVGHAS